MLSVRLKASIRLFNINLVKSLYCRTYRPLSSAIDAAQREEEILKILRAELIDPITQKPLASIGCLEGIKVSKDSKLLVNLNLFVSGYPYEQQIRSQCVSLVDRVSWLQEVQVAVSSSLIPGKRVLQSASTTETSVLSGVRHVVAVSSCKGGVGKSTVAVNLALIMASKGLKVGLLDADVYGPSLPHLLPPLDSTVRKSPTNPKNILPLQCLLEPKLSMLSFGHVNPKSGAPGSGGVSAAVVRGPVVSKILNQMLLCTEWGDLDYLLLDLPPGTGDIQISLTQNSSVSGAVLVTTPHRLALADAAKGVAMFDDLKVPTLAVVENMSFFRCRHGEVYFPFGRGLFGGTDLTAQESRDKPLLKDDFSSPDRLLTRLKGQNCPVHCLPLSPAVSAPDNSLTGEVQSDETSKFMLTEDIRVGQDTWEVPLVKRDPGGEISKVFSDLSDSVIGQLFRTIVDATSTPSVSWSDGRRVILLRYFTPTQALEFTIPFEELRCRDPATGKRLPNADTNQFISVRPVKMEQKGRYAVSFVWSDGFYADIFPFDVLRRIADDCNSVG